MKLKYLIPILGIKHAIYADKGSLELFTLIVWYNFAFFGTAITLLVNWLL